MFVSRRRHQEIYAGGGALGPELVVNGDFSGGTTGWAGGFGGSTIAVVGGELEVTGAGGSFPAARSTAFATVIGKYYSLTGVIHQGTTASQVGIGVVGGATSNLVGTTTPSPASLTFQAVATSTVVSCLIVSATGTGTAYFDNISCRQRGP